MPSECNLNQRFGCGLEINQSERALCRDPRGGGGRSETLRRVIKRLAGRAPDIDQQDKIGSGPKGCYKLMHAF
jgi:hypothetical protein